MTDHRNPESQVPERDRPTRAQLRCLRALAAQTAQSFATPRTKSAASQEIQRLKRAARTRPGRGELSASRTYDRCAVYAPAIRDDETTGYGSTARWS